MFVYCMVYAFVVYCSLIGKYFCSVRFIDDKYFCSVRFIDDKYFCSVWFLTWK